MRNEITERERERERDSFRHPAAIFRSACHRAGGINERKNESSLLFVSLSLSLSLPFDVIEVQVVMAPVDADPGSLAAK